MKQIKDELIKGKTILGKWYVRPISWAGCWRKDEKTHDTYLVNGNTLITSEDERDCNIYMLEKDELDNCNYNMVNECLLKNEELKRLIKENPGLQGKMRKAHSFRYGMDSTSLNFNLIVNLCMLMKNLVN